MAVPLLAMALGGAALGALANPDDRKKGALTGLGLGLLGPALGAAGIGGGGVLGTSLGAGTAGAVTTGAGQTLVGQSVADAVAKEGAKKVAEEGAKTLAKEGAKKVAEEGAKKSLGQMAGGFLKENAGTLAGQGLMMAMQPKPGPQVMPTDVTTGPVTSGQQVSPYERAMVNMQAKRKQAQGPKRYI